MNSSLDSELKPRQIRAFAAILFAIISGSLWAGFAADSYFATDGSFYFTIILDNARFTNIAPSRYHAEILTQWPLVWAVKSGITDLPTLEIFYGLGIWFPWLLSFVICLYATRERPYLIFFFLISVVSLNLAAWCLIYGEHLVLLSIAWPIFFFGILKRPLTIAEQILTGLLLFVHLKVYETTIVSGSIFTLIFGVRALVAGTRRERWGSSALATLALASAVIALIWILFPRDASNRSSFLGAIIATISHPYPWIGLSFVVLNFWGRLFSSAKVLKIAWCLPLAIGVLSLFSPSIMSGIAFSTRTLTLTALPLLMLIAAAISISDFKMTKRWLLSVSALVVGISLLHVRHLQGWLEYRSNFKKTLQEERGFVNSDGREDLVHWGWTNTILSYVWSEGKVESIILNPSSITSEPFKVREEMLLEKYLIKKPEFVEAE